MSMYMNRRERQIAGHKMAQGMTRSEAEEYIEDLRVQQNGDYNTPLRSEHRTQGEKRRNACAQAKKRADEGSKGKKLDPEHPILRKYVPEGIAPKDYAYLPKAQVRALREEISEVYGIPEQILDASRLIENELMIPKLIEKCSVPNRAAYTLLCQKKQKLKGMQQILGQELLDLFWDPTQAVNFIRSLQEKALGEA